MNALELNTGDILLFNEHPTNCCFKWFTTSIKHCTKSRYSHCGMVLKNEFGLTGTYVWESSWHPKEKDSKFGVQITPIEEYTKRYPGTVQLYIRKRTGDTIPTAILERVKKTTEGAPYDIWPCDWVEAKCRCKTRRTTSRFWCSAFVAYILTTNGDISKNCDWSMVRAQDLSSSCTRPPFQWNTLYQDDTRIHHIS